METGVNVLYGVYDADGGLAGEARYLWNAYVRNQHCSLCEITHSKVRRRREWAEFVARCGVPFHALHLNELDPELAAFVADDAPCVVAGTDDGFITVLSDTALQACDGSVARFEAKLDEALKTSGLVRP